MKVLFSERALKDYERLPQKVQKQADKQFGHLLTDLRHPSLKAKKYSEREDRWQARVNDDYRFYFWVHEDIYFIVSITKHPK